MRAFLNRIWFALPWILLACIAFNVIGVIVALMMFDATNAAWCFNGGLAAGCVFLAAWIFADRP